MERGPIPEIGVGRSDQDLRVRQKLHCLNSRVRVRFESMKLFVDSRSHGNGVCTTVQGCASLILRWLAPSPLWRHKATPSCDGIWDKQYFDPANSLRLSCAVICGQGSYPKTTSRESSRGVQLRGVRLSPNRKLRILRGWWYEGMHLRKQLQLATH